MRVSELIKKQEAKQKAIDLHAEESILTSYRNGHIHYALALKQLCAHNLSIQQAKSRLANP